jgi:hypothetical protein
MGGPRGHVQEHYQKNALPKDAFAFYRSALPEFRQTREIWHNPQMRCGGMILDVIRCQKMSH